MKAKLQIPLLAALLSGAVVLPVSAQEVVSLSTEDLLSTSHRAIGCEVRPEEAGGRLAARLVPEGSGGQQLLVLDGVAFRAGSIEFELFASASSRFVGLAWHVADEKNYEAVYFRPFRFQDNDPVGRRRAAQYISHPDYTWNRLRQEFPEVYEGACPVEPEQWIKVRLEVAATGTSQLFVDGIDDPVLSIDRPFPRQGTGVALWTGVGTAASFGEITITPDGSGPVPSTTSASPPAPSSTPSRARPAASSPMGQAVDIPAATGKAIDLLREIDPGQALVGSWSKSGDELVVQPKPFAQIVIPTDFPTSYDVDYSFTRIGPNAESVGLFLPIGASGVAVQFAARGMNDGIGLINGVPSWQGPATRETILENGKRVDASVRVRQSGDRVRIAQYVAGELHVSWEGPVSALSLFQAFRIPSGKAGLGAFDNQTVFHRVMLKPVE